MSMLLGWHLSGWGYSKTIAIIMHAREKSCGFFPESGRIRRKVALVLKYKLFCCKCLIREKSCLPWARPAPSSSVFFFVSFPFRHLQWRASVRTMVPWMILRFLVNTKIHIRIQHVARTLPWTTRLHPGRKPFGTTTKPSVELWSIRGPSKFKPLGCSKENLRTRGSWTLRRQWSLRVFS